MHDISGWVNEPKGEINKQNIPFFSFILNRECILLGNFPSSDAMLLLQFSIQTQEKVVFHYRYLEILDSTKSTVS